ncbi:hypothetical protein N7468_002078 [Penicillium chermesinum]|uniref:Protein TMA23 n=1 Tax=Penicillium chermesinum TaxID=63820 RepID=A0A9W9PHY0_9EURO|nr:uncharacterized protein N7468_002078 [Penicillium chermesinum]KAJ5247095.1 hypothetical protein N7468_002078 [Penicillium chermesinum]KAJ6145342.1 hypothetical protein N7470_009237 [Penicillium chermesinum]
MDAQAYLMRHGWSGPGNPLNPNQRPGPHGGLGLTKPILVARKANNHGVGKKTTKDATNQWWLRGFEDALKDLGQDKPVAAPGNALTSELYRFFVRGEGLAGTMEDNDAAGSDSRRKEKKDKKEQEKSKSKRKRDADDDGERKAKKEKKEEKAARKEEKRRRRKLDVESSGESSGLEKPKESKEERRLRRKQKKKEKKERKLAKEARKSDENSPGGIKDHTKSKKSKRGTPEDDYPTPMSTEQETDTIELKTEAKKEKKNKKSRRQDEDGDSRSKTKAQKEKKGEKGTSKA